MKWEETGVPGENPRRQAGSNPCTCTDLESVYTAENWGSDHLQWVLSPAVGLIISAFPSGNAMKIRKQLALSASVSDHVQSFVWFVDV